MMHHVYFSELGAVHFYCGLAALALGLVVLLLRKGTRLHRAAGLCYVMAMLALNGAALTLYHLTGHFDVFHALALVSLFGVISGTAAAIFRWKNWLHSHYRAMSFSYVGLLAAGTAEIFVHVPALHVHSAAMGIAVGVAMAVVFGIGGSIVVRRLKPSVLASIPQGAQS